MNNFSHYVVIPSGAISTTRRAEERRRGICFSPFCDAQPWLLVASLLFLLPPFAHAQKKTAAGEEFFIVASIDQAQSQLLLKRPTEVTLLAKVTPKTQFADDKGKLIKLSDLRAGDTVWAVTSGGDTNTSIGRLRKGSMTVADLHRYYLDYPEIK
jgi:hypothetical protein